MTVESEDPIYTRVNEYVNTMQWSAEATEYEKTLVIGNLQGFASYLASRENKTRVSDPKEGAERVFLVPTRWGAFTVLERPREAKYIEYIRADLLNGQVIGTLESTVDSDSARRAAEEWFTLRGEKYLNEQPAVGELAAIISKHFATAPADNDAESLLSKIVTIADIGSAEEFGDALERLKSIRELVDTTTKEGR